MRLDHKKFHKEPDSETAFVAGRSSRLLKHSHSVFASSAALAYWRWRRPLLSSDPTKQAGGGSMALKDVLSLYGRIGLIVAAFAFVAGIVAGPVLEKILFSELEVTERSTQPTSPPVGTSSEGQTGKPG